MVREKTRMPEQPVITVLMPVFNDDIFLLDAVESILRQTFRSFEFLIIDDGSTDGTAELLAAIRDPRLRVLHNEKHLGLTCSLKLGIEQAQGLYIARMDADDIALPERLEKQVSFLSTHQEVGILGSDCYVIDQHGRDVGYLPMPEADLQIRWTSLLANPFAHPTVMIRRNVLVQNGLNYDETFNTAQDYELWTRMLRYTRGANLPKPLIQYRVRHGITIKQREVQLNNHDTIALRTIQEQLPEFPITLERVSQLREMFVGGNGSTIDLDAQRVALMNVYIDILMAFVNRHSGEPGLKTIQCQEALKGAILILPYLIQPGWTSVVKRILIINPSLPWRMICHLLRYGIRRLRRVLSNGRFGKPA